MVIMISLISFTRSDAVFCMAAVSDAADGSITEPISPALPLSQLDLGPSLEVVPLKPGRFANLIQRTNNTRHALQVIREDMTSSFVLNLKPNGSATVCRGWRYLFFNDGPQVHTTEHIREQLGYRGRWEFKNGWVQLEIKLDDTACPRVGEYSQLVPRHSNEWHMRCLPIVPRDHLVLTTPVLACRTTNAEPVFGEDEPHVVAGILAGRWIVLGAGNGLKIRLESSSSTAREPSAIQVEVSPDPIPTDSWQQSF
jgi:hypothetical protein